MEHNQMMRVDDGKNEIVNRAAKVHPKITNEIPNIFPLR